MAADPVDEGELQKRAESVADNHDGILPHLKIFYLHGILYASERSVAAFRRYYKALEVGRSEQDIVGNLHEGLTHAAAVSRFFFPVSTRKKLIAARGRNLRKTFVVHENSPLASRCLRNALEHFDERIDQYLLRDLTGYLFPQAKIGDVSLHAPAVGHFFRMVDPQAEKFVLLDEVHSFGDLMEEVERIMLAARDLSR